MRDLAELLRASRVRRGLTQGQVARAAGCSTAYVGLIEQGKRGQRLPRDMAVRLAHALDLNLAATEQLLRASGHLGAGEDLLTDRSSLHVVDAIEADRSLPDRSKRLMISLYETLSSRGAGRGRS